MIKFISFTVIAFTLLAPAGADADDPSVDESAQKRADEFFTRGQLLFEAGDYASAAEAFALAYETAPHPAVLANLALSYDRAGKLTQAVEAYRAYLSTPLDTQKDRDMADRLRELMAQVALIDVTCVPRGCRLVVDGEEKGAAPRSLVLLPGEHRVQAMAEDRASSVRVISLSAGEKRSFEIRIPEAVPSAMEEPAGGELPKEIEVEKWSPGAAFWILGGTTVAAGVATAVFGALTLEEKDHYESSGFTDAEAKKSGERYRLATNIAIGVTAAAGVAAITVAVVRAQRREKETVAFLPGPGLGLTVDRSF